MTFYEINYLETMNKVKIERNKNQNDPTENHYASATKLSWKMFKVVLPEYIDVSLVCWDVLYKAQFDEEKMYI